VSCLLAPCHLRSWACGKVVIGQPRLRAVFRPVVVLLILLKPGELPAVDTTDQEYKSFLPLHIIVRL
jgi:hypothetical protein